MRFTRRYAEPRAGHRNGNGALSVAPAGSNCSVDSVVCSRSVPWSVGRRSGGRRGADGDRVEAFEPASCAQPLEGLAGLGRERPTVVRPSGGCEQLGMLGLHDGQVEGYAEQALAVRCGWKRSLLLDQILERVVHILDLGAGKGIDVGRAHDALNKGDDLIPIDAAVGQS